MLGRFGRVRREEFELASYEELGREVERWRGLALELTHGPRLEPDLGPEL
jgi:hypothetical protein